MTRSEVYVVEKRQRNTWLVATVVFLICLTVLLFCIITLLISGQKSYNTYVNRNSQWTLISETERLPTDIIPVIYNVKLRIYLPFNQQQNYGARNFTFDGSLELKILCQQTTNSFILNAKNLTFKTDDILLLDAKNHIITLTTVETLYQRAGKGFNYFVKFIADTPFIAGDEYFVYIKYTGILGNYLDGGLYRTSYKANNEIRYLILPLLLLLLLSSNCFPTFFFLFISIPKL